MPEPVVTLISGVATIVTNVWRVSKDLYDIIEGIRNAPMHVRVIMVDVDGLYIVLGALQGLLPNVDASRLRADLVPVFESLQLNLNNCCSILIELSRKLIRYTNAAALERIQGKKQQEEERLMENKYDQDLPVKVRRKHRSRSKPQDAEQSDPRNRSLPSLPAQAEL